MNINIAISGAAAPPVDDAWKAPLAALPARLAAESPELLLCGSAGAFHAEFSASVREIRVVGRGRGATADAAARQAAVQWMQRIEAWGEWIARQAPAPAAPGRAAVTRFEYIHHTPSAARQAAVRVLDRARALVEWDLGGGSPFAYINSSTGKWSVVARSEDGRFEELVVES